MTYVKTKKGEQVSPVNPCGLTWPQRFALMMINGQRSDAELSSSINSRFDETMLTLADQGFIERVSSTAQAGVQIDAQTDAAAQGRQKPKEIKRAAVRWLTDHLGPHADPICIQIERAATGDELIIALNLAHVFAVRQLGATRAEGFAAFLPSEQTA